jgi:hypothetical protein
VHGANVWFCDWALGIIASVPSGVNELHPIECGPHNTMNNWLKVSSPATAVRPSRYVRHGCIVERIDVRI